MEPRSHKCKFIEPGVVSYADSDQGTVLVSREALDRMGATFRNCPVIFVPEHHNDASKENAFNFDDPSANPASGIVVGIPYWGDDGWQYVDISVWDEEAQKAIENGYSVSCAYEIDETGGAGDWHQIPYDEEVTNGHYLHMAIVPRPRYEGSQILANSKGGQNMALFGNKPKTKENAFPPPATEKKPGEEKGEMMNADEAVVDMDGTKVPLYELIEAAQMAEGSGNLPKELSDDYMIEVPGLGQKSVAELKDIYRKAMIAQPSGEAQEGEQMENAEPPTDVQGVSPVDQSKQLKNAKSSPVQKPVVNVALRNAALNPEGEKPGRGIETESQRLERGHARYSIPVKNGGSK